MASIVVCGNKTLLGGLHLLHLLHPNRAISGIQIRNVAESGRLRETADAVRTRSVCRFAQGSITGGTVSSLDNAALIHPAETITAGEGVHMAYYPFWTVLGRSYKANAFPESI
jgi:hypothetical protein